MCHWSYTYHVSSWSERSSRPVLNLQEPAVARERGEGMSGTRTKNTAGLSARPRLWGGIGKWSASFTDVKPVGARTRTAWRRRSGRIPRPWLSAGGDRAAAVGGGVTGGRARDHGYDSAAVGAVQAGASGLGRRLTRLQAEGLPACREAAMVVGGCEAFEAPARYRRHDGSPSARPVRLYRQPAGPVCCGGHGRTQPAWPALA
mgnify:CR=1 FL=1